MRNLILVLSAILILFVHPTSGQAAKSCESCVRLDKTEGWELAAIDKVIAGTRPTRVNAVDMGGAVVMVSAYEVDNVELGDIPVLTKISDRFWFEMVPMVLTELKVFSFNGHRYAYALETMRVHWDRSRTHFGFGSAYTVVMVDETGNGRFNLMIEWSGPDFQVVPPNWTLAQEASRPARAR